MESLATAAVIESPKPLVTVIIPSYNTSATVGRTVESIASTAYPRLQVLIVDDGSKDESLQTLAALREKYPFIEVYSHPGNSNHGIAATRNLGLSHARGKYVAFTDADDTFLPNRFETCIALMEADSLVNVVVEPYEQVFVSGARAAEMTRGSETGRTTVSPVMADESSSDDLVFLFALKHGGFPHTTSITVRKSALDQTDLFPALLYNLEKPLWLQLYSLGGVRRGSDSAVSQYFLHGESTCARHEGKRAFRSEEVMVYLLLRKWMSRRRISSGVLNEVSAVARAKYMHYTTYARKLSGTFFRDIVLSPFRVASSVPPLWIDGRFWWASIRMIFGYGNQNE